jgi:hypothetical protein
MIALREVELKPSYDEMALVMPEEGDQNDHRQWHANQPKQSSATESHFDLLSGLTTQDIGVSSSA